MYNNNNYKQNINKGGCSNILELYDYKSLDVFIDENKNYNGFIGILDKNLSVIWASKKTSESLPYINFPDAISLILPGFSKQNIISMLQKGHTFRSDDGKHRGLIYACITITPILKNEELEYSVVEIFVSPNQADIAQNAALPEEFNRVISTFNSSFRTPLTLIFSSITQINSIITFSDAGVNLAPCVDEISRNAYRMLRACFNISEYITFTSYTNPLKLKRINFTTQLQNFFFATNIVILSSITSFKYHLPEKELMLVCDFEKISIVILNIIANSVIACDEGARIEVFVEYTDTQILFRICDNGVGIPDDILEKVFEPFFSYDYNNGNFCGAGIGLTISRYIINQHGGSITIHSAVGKGSTVAFSLPIHDDTTKDVVVTDQSAQYLSNRFSSLYIQLSDLKNCKTP